MASALPGPIVNSDGSSTVTQTQLDAYIKESVDANIAGGNTFADATALRANTTYVNGVMYYVSVVTGGTAGGEWVYNSTDSQTDDGVNVIKPDNIASGSPGRYTRQINILIA